VPGKLPTWLHVSEQQSVLTVQTWPTGQRQQVGLADTSRQHSSAAEKEQQQVLPQQWFPEPQQVVPPQQGWSQQPLLQLCTCAPAQHVWPAQPLAGGVQVIPEQSVTFWAQTLLKQLSAQHSLPCVQGWPSTFRQRPPQHRCPVGQVKHSSPPVPHNCGLSTPPQKPGLPGPLVQQPVGQKSASH
jgi:hypothetical protein